MQVSNRVLLWLAAAACGMAVVGILWPVPDPAKYGEPSTPVPQASTPKPTGPLVQSSPAQIREQLLLERLKMQNPLRMLPDATDSELQSTRLLPWGATDPDAFWHAQMLKVNQTMRESGLDTRPEQMRH